MTDVILVRTCCVCLCLLDTINIMSGQAHFENTNMSSKHNLLKSGS